jgi:hypothetical protein
MERQRGFAAEGPAACRAGGSRTSRADPQQAGPVKQLFLKHMLKWESAYFKAKCFDRTACASKEVLIGS